MAAPRPLRSALLVIGSAPLRSMYAEYLTWRGADVREVESASAALGALATFAPQAIVVEDRLADATGLRLARAIRRYPSQSAVPMVLLSSDVFGMNADQARRSGCDLLLTIPCLPETLFGALTALTGDECREARPAAPDAWLFVREQESIRIVRAGDAEMVVCGPGHQRESVTCAGPIELVTWQMDFEERLVTAGYVLDPVRSERRTGHERRTTVRGSDRRWPLVAAS